MPRTLEPDRASDLGKRSVQVRRIAALERRILELVDSAPPLTDAQRRQLAVLLAPRDAA